MANDSPYSVSQAVIFAQPGPGSALEMLPDIKGTAFNIGGDFFLTAGHVVQGQPPSGQFRALAFQRDSGFFGVRVVDAEVLSKDLGILALDSVGKGYGAHVHMLPWTENKSWSFFEPVRSIGYGYGIQNLGGELSLVIRGFQGHLVTCLNKFRPVGSTAAPYEALELSFAAPCGLSGAPLIEKAGKLLGVVTGNSESKMMVYHSKETLKERGETTEVERYEGLTLGIAVPSWAVVPTYSKLLGCTIGEHLRKHRLF